MGRRINLATLASEEVLEAPVPRIVEITSPTTVRVDQVASNPINPREDFGDLSDLESMQTVGQLQPCVVVTRSAFLAVYPEHESVIGAAQYVVVAGSRRRAAAELLGLATLDIIVRDQLAASRAQFYAAAVAENIDRKSLDVLEEARAVQRLAHECGSGAEAGAILGKTKGWVSQRLALLKLSREMQAFLRSGELPVRDGRRLAALPGSDQLPAWRQEQEQAARERFTAVNPGPADSVEDPQDRTAPGVGHIAPSASPTTNAERRPGPSRLTIHPGATVPEIADLLRNHLNSDDLQALIEVLIADVA